MLLVFCVWILLTTSECKELTQETRSLSTSRQTGIGLEEVVLFLIGLGVASATGLAVVAGPMFTFFMSAFSSIMNGGNAASTSAGRKRRSVQKSQLFKLLKTVEDALMKFDDSTKRPNRI